MKRIIFYSLDDRGVKIRKYSEQSRVAGVPIRDYFDEIIPVQDAMYEFWDGKYYMMGYITEYQKSNVDDCESYIRVEVIGEPKTKEG